MDSFFVYRRLQNTKDGTILYKILNPAKLRRLDYVYRQNCSSGKNG